MQDPINEQLLAQDPSTAPRLLEVLAQSDDLRVRSAVAQNPNTPPAALLALAPSFPAEFCQNPSLPLFLIEDPNFLQNFSWELVNRLTEIDTLPDFLLEALASSSYEHIRRKIAAHPRLPPAALAAFLVSENQHLRYRAAQNPNAGQLLQDLCLVGGDPSLQGFGVTVPVEEALLQRLATAGFWARVLVARHPQTPPALLAILAEDSAPAVRIEAAGNPHLSSEALEAALQDPDERVVGRAVQNQSLSQERWAGLLETHLPAVWAALSAADEPLDWEALKEALQNKRSSGFTQGLLRFFSSHENPEVRAAVAAHPDLNPELLGKLSHDGSPLVRRTVAQHPLADKGLLDELLGDDDDYVRKQAATGIENRYTPFRRLDSKLSKPRRKKLR